VRGVLDRSVGPLAIARGGEISLVDASDGLVTLEMRGSPGALRPLAGQVEALVRGALPRVSTVQFVGPGAETASDGPSVSLAERVRRVLEEEVNPAIRHHRGRAELVEIVDGLVHLRLEGGCQGCSLAAVTVLQGIEPLLRERLPDIAGVVDVTDHGAGRDPFYSPEKR
jgi:Fe-S cluster biogenesis protein NfuA